MVKCPQCNYDFGEIEPTNKNLLSWEIHYDVGNERVEKHYRVHCSNCGIQFIHLDTFDPEWD